MLGPNILGSGFAFDVTIHRGAGAFVSGESSALMSAIEGRVGEPRPKYVRTAVSGIWGRPTNLNNVETWATVPLIIEKGADWFRSIGTENSKGTKIFSLVGKVSNTGLVEVPDGHDAQGGGLRHRRRHAQEPEVQGRPDGRAVGRGDPGGAPGPPGGLRRTATRSAR